MICKTCGASLLPDDAFCSKCGTSVSIERKTLDKCPHCGACVQEGDLFCRGCGASLEDTPTEPTPSICPRCGAPVVTGNAFCGKCGLSLVANVSAASSTSDFQTSRIGAIPTIQPEPYAPPVYSAPAPTPRRPTNRTSPYDDTPSYGSPSYGGDFVSYEDYSSSDTSSMSTGSVMAIIGVALSAILAIIYVVTGFHAYNDRWKDAFEWIASEESAYAKLLFWLPVILIFILCLVAVRTGIATLKDPSGVVFITDAILIGAWGAFQVVLHSSIESAMRGTINWLYNLSDKNAALFWMLNEVYYSICAVTLLFAIGLLVCGLVIQATQES